jgi:hypothetical protein
VKLFLDANIYLDFYEIQAVKPLIEPLLEVREHVLVTEQVVSEVLRNKLTIANKKLEEYYKKLNISLALPDILTENAIAEIDQEASQKLKELSSNLKEFKELLAEVYAKTTEHLSRNEDKVSMTLEKVFQGALQASDEQMVRARLRKELGNPPGKKGDPIGDEINWEILLDYAAEEKCPIWVVSKDGDFSTQSLDKSVLGNPYLLKEIQDKTLTPFVFFNDLASALKEFSKKCDTQMKLPSEDQLAAATQAQRTRRIISRDECDHEIRVFPNGIYDVYRCVKCGMEQHVLADGCCD